MSIPAIDQLDVSQAGKEQTINELFNGLRSFFVLQKHESASVGLGLVLYGGRFGGSDLADQSLTLPASSTSYIEANSTTGVISQNTTSYTSGKIPLGIAITSSTGLTSYVPEALGGVGVISGVSLGAVNVWTKNQSVAPVTLTDGATVNIDASLSNDFKWIIAGNHTLANPTNPAGTINLIIKQDSTGSRTWTLGTKYKFPGGGGTPPLSTGPSAVDLLSCKYYVSDDIWVCNLLTNFG